MVQLTLIANYQRLIAFFDLLPRVMWLTFCTATRSVARCPQPSLAPEPKYGGGSVVRARSDVNFLVPREPCACTKVTIEFQMTTN